MELANEVRAVVALPEGYRVAYSIFKVTCERSIINLSDTHRKILDAVYKLKEKSAFDDGFSQRKIAAKAGVSVSTVSENKTFLAKSVKLLYEAEEGGLTLVADAEPDWWRKSDELLAGFPRPEQVERWWKDKKTSTASKTAEHAEHPNDEDSIPFTYGKKGVRQETEHVRQDSERENGLGNPESVTDGEVFGVFGCFEGSPEESTDERAGEENRVSGVGRVPVSFDLKPGTSATVEELTKRRGQGEQQERLAEDWKNHPLDCQCDDCEWGEL